MLKLREPFSKKVHLHIRQDILQRLWDKYVPTSSPEYEQIELVYLKDALKDMGKQPEQIQLLLHLILKNKKLQLNLMQYPALMKIGQKQMESSLRRMEQYYAVQLKCSDLTMYRTVRQYFTLLEQAEEEGRRYQGWQKNHQEIKKQKDEYRLLSLFSEKLRDYLTEYSVNTLRAMERKYVYSLSDIEYQMLAEELIWQEKSECLAYFDGWDEAQCGNVVRELEKDTGMRQVLSQVSYQSVKEKLLAAVERLEQREFCLFYHQVLKMEDVNPQVVMWKESKTEMLYEIDRLESEALQQMWKQLGDMTHPLEPDARQIQENGGYDQNARQIQENGSHDQNARQIQENGGHDQNVLQTQENGSYDQNALQIQEPDIQDLETLRTLEKKQLYSLLKTEYQTLAEQLIWQEKQELIAYFKGCETAQCKEIVKELKKDTYIGQILSLFQKQSAKKKLIAAAYKLEQKEFSLFYWQVVDLKDVDPQMVIWKKSRTQMLRSIDEMGLESLQKVWAQMETVGPVKGSKHVFSEKMLHLRNQYQLNERRNFQEQIAVMLKENALEAIVDIVDMEQLMHDISMAEYTEKSAGDTEELEFEFRESEQLVFWDGAYQVIRNLEREREIRRERIEQQQAQAVETYQDAYRQMLRTENILVQQQEDTAQTAERIFRKQYQEQLTGEEIQNICEWSQALLEIYFAEQGQAESQQAKNQQEIISSFSYSQREQQELAHVVEQINHYIEGQQGFGERLLLHWQEDLSKDERIKKLLIYIQELEKEQQNKFIYYLADMFHLSVQLSSQRKVSTVGQPDRTESAGLPIQDSEQESVEKSLWIEDREFVEKLQQIEDREFAEKLLQIEDREFAEKLLRIENREFVEKLLQNSDKQLLDVSYSNLWEWGETLLFHPEHQQEWEDADILAAPQQEEFPSDEATQEEIQTQVIRRQIEMAKNRNRLQGLIRQVNHQADIQLVYTDAQLRMPQVQALLQYVQKLDEKQYGVFVKELVQIIKIQKQSNEELEAGSADVHAAGKENIEKLLQVENREFAERLLHPEYQPEQKTADVIFVLQQEALAKELAQAAMIQRMLHEEPGTAVHTEEENNFPDTNFPDTREVSLEQRMIPYPILTRYIQNYEKRHQLELYRDIRKIEKKIFPQADEKENRQYAISTSTAGNYAQGRAAYDLMPYEAGINKYDLTLYEAGMNEYDLTPYEAGMNEYTLTPYEAGINEYGLTPYEAGINEYSLTLQEEMEKEYVQLAARGKVQRKSGYQPQELEYSVQKASASEEEQQRKELRMQQENARMKSEQEQLDKKLKEVEHQLKKVEDSTKAKEEVRSFAEQVKKQLYEELHVEKLRRGLI